MAKKLSSLWALVSTIIEQDISQLKQGGISDPMIIFLS